MVDGTNSIEFVNAIVPVVTFILGVASTLALGRYERKRDASRHSVEEICRLAKEWYGQILSLITSPYDPDKEEKWSDHVYEYLNNRLILPDVLFHIEVLSGNKKYSALVESAKKFLERVTEYRPDGRSMCCRLRIGPPEHQERLIEDLDVILQDLSREAARLSR